MAKIPQNNRDVSGSRRPTTLLPDERPNPPAGASWRRVAAASPRLLIVVVVCVLVPTVLAIWLAVGDGDGRTPADAPERRNPEYGQPAPGAGAGQVQDGVAVGYEHSRAGAVAAAVNYEMARTRPDYFTDGQVRRNVLSAMMTRDAFAAQLAGDDSNAEAVMTRLGLQPGGAGPGGARFLIRSAPLGTRVTSYSAEVATVDVWMAEVVGVVGENSPMPPTASWTLYSLTLAWQGDWKIASLSTTPAPVPVSGGRAPSSSMEWTRKLEGFDAPPPVS